MIGSKKTNDKTVYYVYNQCMREQRIISLTVFLLIGMMLVLPPANAEPYRVMAADSARLKKQEVFCQQIQDKIRNEQNVRNLVKTDIQIGHDACEEIKCSIKGSGDLQQVLCGASEAGTTKDVVSRCAIDAGADPKEVAAILNNISETGLCNEMPEKPEVIDPPPSGGSGGFISPSRF